MVILGGLLVPIDPNHHKKSKSGHLEDFEKLGAHLGKVPLILVLDQQNLLGPKKLPTLTMEAVPTEIMEKRSFLRFA